MPEPLDTGTSQVSTQEAPAQGQQTEQPQAPQSPSPQGGGHPAWNDFRSAVGDTTFKLVEPHLTKYDQAAQERITALNAKLDGYTAFGEPDQITQWQQLAQAVDNDPLAFYQQYGDFLRQQGLLQEDAPGGDDPDSPFASFDEGEEDPRIAQLQEQQQQILDQIENQRFEEEVAQQSQQLEQTLTGLREANPWMDDTDINGIVQRAQALMQAGETKDPVGAAAAEYIGLREKFMGAPRPNDLAPKLIPSGGGGNPASGQQPDPSKMTAVQRQQLVTQMLQNR